MLHKVPKQGRKKTIEKCDPARQKRVLPGHQREKQMKLLDDPAEWLSLKEAAYLLRVSRHTVVRLCEEMNPTTRKPYLHGWRVTRGTLLVSRVSLNAYCTATQGDFDYWCERKPRRIRPTTAGLRGPARIPVGRSTQVKLAANVLAKSGQRK